MSGKIIHNKTFKFFQKNGKKEIIGLLKSIYSILNGCQKDFYLRILMNSIERITINDEKNS